MRKNEDTIATAQALPDKNFVVSLQKGLDALTCFGRQHSRFSDSEVGRLTQSSPASARRSLLTLQTLGYRTVGLCDDCVAQQKRPGLCSIEVLEGFCIALFILPAAMRVFCRTSQGLEGGVLGQLNSGVWVKNAPAPSPVSFV